MANNLGRYPKDHPRSGGFVVFWAQQTLNCEKFRNPKILGLLVKVVCVAQLVDFTTGRFEKGGMPFPAQTIANRAGITGEDFNNLVSMGLVSKEDKDGILYFAINSWNEHQNPKDSRSAEETAFNVRKEPHQLEKRSATIHSPFTKHHSPSTIHHSKDLKPKLRVYKNEKA